VQTPLLVVVAGAIVEGAGGTPWRLPLGLLFAFWQWERLMVYHADFKAGDVPRDLPFLDYLSIFMSPGLLSNHYSAPYVGQGYTYLASKFLASDKNRIVVRGLGLLGLAALYFVLGEPLVREIVHLADRALGLRLYTSTSRMVEAWLEGTPMGPPTVLFSTILDQFRIYLVFGALTHFRIGAWRLLGHDVDPQYNKPWMATNLVAFWGRFAFHYREFLVRTFYYPIFFRFFKKNLMLRVFVATMISTSIGNHIWGHVPDRLLSRGMTWENLVLILRAWPYYLLLGLGISLSQLYLMRKGRTRKPWTADRRLVLDVLAAYATIQYFCLIHIFARPQPDGSLADLARLVLIGLGIRL
jgi:hypothetical protein